MSGNNVKRNRKRNASNRIEDRQERRDRWRWATSLPVWEWRWWWWWWWLGQAEEEEALESESWSATGMSSSRSLSLFPIGLDDFSSPIIASPRLASISLPPSLFQTLNRRAEANPNGREMKW